MTDTEVAPDPKTPADAAARVLDAIEAQPDVFRMDHWAWLADTIRLAPEEAPACGSQLCAAGWAAHVTGWTLCHCATRNRQRSSAWTTTATSTTRSPASRRSAARSAA